MVGDAGATALVPVLRELPVQSLRAVLPVLINHGKIFHSAGTACSKACVGQELGRVRAQEASV